MFLIRLAQKAIEKGGCRGKRGDGLHGMVTGVEASP